ncbi:MAG: hypothetical protein AAF481_10765 [Acidobacteriota bacterium]
MPRFRYLSAPAAWLMLAAFVLGGGLIATHSHDGHPGGEFSSVVLTGGHDLPNATKHVESSTSIDGEQCPACAAGRRQGALDASQPTSRAPVMVTRDVRAADDLMVSGFDDLPPAPRGPPIV